MVLVTVILGVEFDVFLLSTASCSFTYRKINIDMKIVYDFEFDSFE